jgi:hypothetical protein
MMDEEIKKDERVEDDAPAEADGGESAIVDEPRLSEVDLALLDEMKEEGWDESTYFNRLYALKELEEQRRRQSVNVALGKFNFFMHLTAFISGLAYLLLLGILYRPALPYVFIPIGLWTVGISYHFYRSFYKPSKPGATEQPGRKKKSASQPLGWIDEESEPEPGEDSTTPGGKTSGD